MGDASRNVFEHNNTFLEYFNEGVPKCMSLALPEFRNVQFERGISTFFDDFLKLVTNGLFSPLKFDSKGQAAQEPFEKDLSDAEQNKRHTPTFENLKLTEALKLFEQEHLGMAFPPQIYRALSRLHEQHFPHPLPSERADEAHLGFPEPRLDLRKPGNAARAKWCSRE